MIATPSAPVIAAVIAQVVDDILTAAAKHLAECKRQHVGEEAAEAMAVAIVEGVLHTEHRKAFELVDAARTALWLATEPE